MRSKVVPGLPAITANEIWRGDFLGRDLDDEVGLFAQNWGPGVQRRYKDAIEQVIPLFFVDVHEAMIEDWHMGLPLLPVQFFGGSTGFYGEEESRNIKREREEAMSGFGEQPRGEYSLPPARR